jgi:hypothetical protein
MQTMQPRRAVIPAWIGAWLVSLAAAAQAAFYSVSASNKSFCCTTGGTLAVIPHTVMGIATGAPATQYGPVHFDKSEAVDFMKLTSWWSNFPAMGTKLPPPGFKYIVGVQSVVNTAGTLKSGGGYGSFEFCPKAKGPGPGACSDPDNATPMGFNGRIAVKAGAKKFGGTLGLAKGIGGKGGPQARLWRWLGGAMSYPAAIVSQKLLSTVVGRDPAEQAEGTVKTKIFGHTAKSMTYPIASYPSGMIWENGAGPFTTGTVYVGAFGNGTYQLRTISIMGVNNRTALGGGNLQVVSGVLFNRYNTQRTSPFPLVWQLDITLPEPSANLGLVAGSMALLLIGRIATRRGNRNPSS